MVEKLKLGGLVLALCPCNKDFIGFERPSVFTLACFRKILSSFVGVKSVPLLGLIIL